MARQTSLRQLFPLYLVIFFGFIGYSMAITIFTPLFISENSHFFSSEMSLSDRTILLGFVLFLYPFGQFISSPVLGALSDRFGRRPLLVYTLALTTFFYFFIGLALYLESLTLLCLSLFFSGLSEGNITIAQSTITDVTEVRNRSRYFGYIYLSTSLAFIVGPLIGGKLTYYFNEATPFWVATFFLFLTTLWIFFSFQETHPKEKWVHIRFLEALTNLKNIFKEKALTKYFLINFLLYLSIFGFFRTYPMYIVDEYKVSVDKLSEFVSWLSVPIIVMNLGFIKLIAQKFTAFQMMVMGAVCTAIFIFMLIIPHPMWALWFTLFLCGGAIAVALPAAPTLLSSKAKDSIQGSVMGNNQSLQFFSEAISGLLGGFFAAIFIKLSLIIFASLSILAALLLFFNNKSSKRSS